VGVNKAGIVPPMWRGLTSRTMKTELCGEGGSPLIVTVFCQK